MKSQWTNSPTPNNQQLINVVGTSQVALAEKNMPANAGDTGDMGSIPGSWRSPGGGHGNPLQYSCLENPMDRGAWRATVHVVAKSHTWLKRLSTHNQCCYLPWWMGRVKIIGVLPVADVCGGPTGPEMEEIWEGNCSSRPFKIEKLGHRDVIQLLNHHTLSSGTGHLGPIKVASAFYWAASPWPRPSRMPFSPGSPVIGQESGPSLEVVIKSSLEPWGGGSKGSCLAGWSRGLRPISAALGSWQQVQMMNGQLNAMEQIDHCITDHNLFISAKRAIHYPGCHTAHVIARGKSPKPHSLGFSSHLTPT